jgi:hypothetical protein
MSATKPKLVSIDQKTSQPQPKNIPGAGLFYTAVYYLSDGTTSTEYRRIKSTQLFGVFGGTYLQFATCPWTVNRDQLSENGELRITNCELGSPMRMMNEFEAQVLRDLNVLKTQENGLMGDGNGGRVAEFEHRVDRHEQNWQRQGIHGGL